VGKAVGAGDRDLTDWRKPTGSQRVFDSKGAWCSPSANGRAAMQIEERIPKANQAEHRGIRVSCLELRRH
jgi:hypothetical protein